MPPFAVTVVVLPLAKAPPVGPEAIEILTGSELSAVSMLPNWSNNSTCTAGTMAMPAVVLLGCTMVLLAVYNRFAGLDRLWG